MKIVGLTFFVSAAIATNFGQDLCPHDKEVQCITDVNHALDSCDKAAKSKGKDQQADFQCIKYFAAVEKDCWPCICQIAKDNDYHIKGC